MKKFTILIILCLLFSCESGHDSCKKNKEEYISYFGNNKIELKGFVQKTTREKETYASFGFFLFIGGGSYSEKTIENTEVMFYWKTKNDTFKLERKPLDFFRIKIDNEIKKPYLSFVFYDDLSLYGTLDTLGVNNGYRIKDPEEMYNIRYAIVNCNDSQWSPKFNLPLE